MYMSQDVQLEARPHTCAVLLCRAVFMRTLYRQLFIAGRSAWTSAVLNSIGRLLLPDCAR